MMLQMQCMMLFTKVLCRPEAYNVSNGPLKPWFFRIVRNGCIDVTRRRRPTDDTVDELIEASPGPESLAESSQRDEALGQALADLGQALAELASGQREIIVLRDYLR